MSVDRNANSDVRQRRALQKLLASGQIHKHVSGENPAGAKNGVNTTFTLAHTPKTGTLQLYLNGLLQDFDSTDFDLVGKVITMTDAPFTGDVLRAWYIKEA